MGLFRILLLVLAGILISVYCHNVSSIAGKKSKLSTGQVYMQLLIFMHNLRKHQIVHYCNYSNLLSMARRRANVSRSP